MKSYPVESILSARQLVSPQLAEDYIYFVSDMSGMMSLYRMKKIGSFPERLLPAGLALQNPHLMAGHLFVVFPKLGKVLVMIDENGNELYQPSFIPLEGGIPESIFGDRYAGQQVICAHVDIKKNITYFRRDDRTVKDRSLQYSIRVNLETMEETELGVSEHGFIPTPEGNHSRIFLSESYISGDFVIRLWEEGKQGLKKIIGTPLDERDSNEETVVYNVFPVHWFGNKILLYTTIFDDLGGFALIDLDSPLDFHEVQVANLMHKGAGELDTFEHIDGNRFMIGYNIDGCSWNYEVEFDIKKVQMNVIQAVVGQHPLDGGIELGIGWDQIQDYNSRFPSEYVISFTSATKPSQLYLMNSSKKKPEYTQLSYERVLGISEDIFSPGEDASYKTFDGLRISARLYLPSSKLNYQGPRPLVLYVHGGPQGQERPDFTWFSMPLIQLLTMNGFAVFVPNVRGSTGYGFEYMKHVDHDWGGNDRLDHVEGLKFLEKDTRIDSSRRAVVGRSYGGYMTLILATRHPELWQAACDMFGPYNLITFVERLPESWAAYFYLSIGHPEKDADFLKERSPSTYMNQLSAPLLVVQGKNDPRVVESESKDIVDRLNASGKHVEYLMFEDEGHDVLKYENKVEVYNRIVDFFKRYLKS
ncbi:MAG: S9 family peptidase [Candidatus Thorarchaeota archaeon]|nr:S9 family peptidase [Candidatus Thorarchaeota archaeon]